MVDLPKLLTISDIAKRWDMPRQSIHERIKYREFPDPVQFVSSGRTALFLEEDIRLFEEENPWITSPEKRKRRQKFIFSLINQ